MAMTVDQLFEKFEQLKLQGFGNSRPQIEIGGTGGVLDVIASRDQMDVWIMTTDEA